MNLARRGSALLMALAVWPVLGQANVAPASAPTSDRLGALYQLLTISFVVLLVFLLGVYAIARARRLAPHSGPRSRTRYVDAWANYRVSDEAIDAATDEPGGRRPPEADKDKDDDNPP